jgi:hypothetical protein
MQASHVSPDAAQSPRQSDWVPDRGLGIVQQKLAVRGRSRYRALPRRLWWGAWGQATDSRRTR